MTTRDYLTRLSQPENTVVVIRNREAFSWLPNDNVNATSPLKATELFPLFTEAGVGEGHRGTNDKNNQNTEKAGSGPNRVEYSYSVPYHMEKMDAHLIGACSASTDAGCTKCYGRGCLLWRQGCDW